MLVQYIVVQVYNVRSVCDACGLSREDSTFIIGPGAGPFADVGVNSEVRAHVELE